MNREDLVKKVLDLQQSAEFNEFDQWCDETFAKCIPHLPIKVLKILKNNLTALQEYFESDEIEQKEIPEPIYKKRR